MNLWMSRVPGPTDANIADDPSRGHVELLVSSGCCRQHVDVRLMWNALRDVTWGGSDQQCIPLLKRCDVIAALLEWSCSKT